MLASSTLTVRIAPGPLIGSRTIAPAARAELLPGGARAIRDAVHTDLDVSASIYAWVREVCEALGADASDLVPFEKYANAARGLAKPSSAARALYAGAPNIERVDKLVQILAASKGMQSDVLNQTVGLVDARLEQNRAQAG